MVVSTPTASNVPLCVAAVYKLGSLSSRRCPRPRDATVVVPAQPRSPTRCRSATFPMWQCAGMRLEKGGGCGEAVGRELKAGVTLPLAVGRNFID